MYVVGLFLFLIIMASQSAARAKVISAHYTLIEDTTSRWTTLEIVGIAALVLMLLSYGILFTFLIRQLRAPSAYVRINHEGIFTSRDSFLIKWAEIQELSFATFRGLPYLRIVPWDLQEVAARAKASSRPSMRFGINVTLRLSPRSKSPIGLSQMVLPIPIHELLTAIQEQFGTQLREHHILMQGSEK